MSRLRIAIGASTFGTANPLPLNRLAERGFDVVPNPFGRRLNEDETIAHLEGAVGLIAGLEPLNERVLGATTSLRALARVGIGMDNVDTAVARKMGIKVSNTPNGPTDAVAEMTLTCLLLLFRRVAPANEALHARKWTKMMGEGISEKRVLVVGYGRIGRKVAATIATLGARVQVADPAITPEAAAPFELVPLNAGLAVADAVLLHASGSERIIGAGELSLLPPGGLVLNAARGALLDEQALLNAIERGHVAGAWLDTFSEEPYSGPLCDRSEVILTPHMSTYTRQCREQMEIQAVENLLRDLGD